MKKKILLSVLLLTTISVDILSSHPPQYEDDGEYSSIATEVTETPFPIVYHTRYPPGCTKIYNQLTKQVGIGKKQFHIPKEIENYKLCKVHCWKYFEDLQSFPSAMVSFILEKNPLYCLSPNWWVRYKEVTPRLLATGGTLQSIYLAIKHGCAINLFGGFSRATMEMGDDLYADIPLAALRALRYRDINKVLIVDTGNQKNGHQEMFKELNKADKVDIVDSKGWYTGSHAQNNGYTLTTTTNTLSHWAPEAFDKKNYNIQRKKMVKTYFDSLKACLNEGFQKQNPKFIIYNSGTTFHVKKMDHSDKEISLTPEEIRDRDQHIFNMALQKEIPIVMLLSGNSKSVDSIENLYKNVIPNFKKD